MFLFVVVGCGVDCLVSFVSSMFNLFFVFGSLLFCVGYFGYDGFCLGVGVFVLVDFFEFNVFVIVGVVNVVEMGIFIIVVEVELVFLCLLESFVVEDSFVFKGDG